MNSVTMKSYSLMLFLLVLFSSGCGTKSNETASDSTRYENDTIPQEVSTGISQEQARVNRFLEDFKVIQESLPSITYLEGAEMGSRIIHYYFEDDNLVSIHIDKSGEGGYAENTILCRDPEGETVLNYSTEAEGFYGYTGAQTSEWYTISIGENSPQIMGPREQKVFEYEKELKTHLDNVVANKRQFKLENGVYKWIQKKEKYKGEYGDAERIEQYEVSEVLFTSNLLSETHFDPKFIKGYLNSWYPLYENASGGFERHTICNSETYIKIVVEAGHYSWIEQGVQDAVQFEISAFQESEGDAFYATLTSVYGTNKKTLIFDEKSNLLHIDGRIYTSESEKFNVINEASNCN